MKSLKKNQRIQIIALVVVCLLGSTALIGYAMRDGINFFRAPVDVALNPPGPEERFRIGGLVEMGSLERRGDGRIRFLVTDGGASIPVVFQGVPPDLFGEGEGMVGTGYLKDGVFEADEILARHDETYMPRDVVDALEAQGVYRPASAASTSR